MQGDIEKLLVLLAHVCPMRLISIITVNYHQSATTVELLRSVIRHPGKAMVEVVLVDNGTAEDHGALYRSVYPELIYIRSEENLGFAGGNNLGIRHAKGDYLLFLNNDTEITDRFIDSLCDELDSHPEFGLISPLILYDENPQKIQYAGFTPMNYLTGRNSGIGVMEDDLGQFDHVTVETGYCHGAAMLCRTADLERVGLMEEDFFLYYEELDWCEKFRRAGFRMGFTGKAKIYHKESMSVGKESPLKTYHMTRNRWLFIRRNATVSARMLFASYYVLVAMPFAMVKYLAKGRSDLAKAAVKGVWWHFTHAVDTPKGSR